MSAKEGLCDDLTLASLMHVPFDGWTADSLIRGADDIGLTCDDVNVLFPDGPRGVVNHWFDLADRFMLEDLMAVDLGSLRIRDRIATIVRVRLTRWTPHRDAVRRAIALSILPGFAENSVRSGYATIDAIWRAAGDTATDFNFYTKRGLLAAVYSSTLLVWLDDRSEGCADTWAFLDRRIANVMKVPKIQGRLEEAFSRLPNLLSALRRARRAVLR